MEQSTPIPTLCLNMIVKNESNVITRLLSSVVSLIDAYCICDTGSTDNTIQLIEDFFREKDIPGKIIQEPFRSFCHNRNVALQACHGLADYVLLLDADMILRTNGFDKRILTTANSFYVTQGNDSFFYQNLRIVQNNGLYTYIGVTHEYVDTPPHNKTIALDKRTVFIQDVGDGGSKQDKFERDIRLLTEGINQEPQNVPRYTFYLANSYFDLRRYDEAIPHYKERISFGGWREEVWYSYYKLGLCYAHLSQFPNALYYWLEGFNYYPDRLEALYEIIKHYRIQSKHQLCMQFYDMAIKVLRQNHARDAYLFLHNDVYTYKLHYEYSIFASYCGIKNINDAVVQVMNHSSNRAEIDNLLSNMKFYKDVLPAITNYRFDASVCREVGGENVAFVSSSSCLIKQPMAANGYMMNVRYVNYHIEPDGQYTRCDKHIVSLNQCVELDDELRVVKETWMDLPYEDRRYIGVEDVKIYTHKCEALFIGTGFHANNRLGVVSGTYDTQTAQLRGHELTQRFQQTQCEKNWVFVPYKGQLHIVYDWFPLRMGLLDDSRELFIVETRAMPKLFSRVRGSTCGFEYAVKQDTELWFINHLVSYETPRHYYHIISVFDGQMNLLRYSAPFTLVGDPIEYCLSIVVEDTRVFINYSTWDRTTRIGVYEKTYIESMLIIV